MTGGMSRGREQQSVLPLHSEESTGTFIPGYSVTEQVRTVNGPIPWREEIKEAIESCSKFVAFVDKAWLTSYNCLQELALAFQYDKPIAVIMLEGKDGNAWKLIVDPHGASLAKTQADAQLAAAADAPPPLDGSINSNVMLQVTDSEAMYTDTRSSRAVCTYEGEDIVPGMAMSLDVMKNLFGKLESINLCDCGNDNTLTSDEDWRKMVSTALGYVEKDLVYHKQHAELKNEADAWQAAVKAQLPLPLLQKDEAVFWRQWLKDVEQHNLKPQPTKHMGEFVGASERHTIRRRRQMMALGMLLVLVLVAGVVASALMARRAHAASNLAQMRAVEAEEARDDALGAERLAEQRALEAHDARDEALAAENLAEQRALEAHHLCGGWDTTVRVWRVGEDGAVEGSALLVLRGHTGHVTSVAWAPDGRSLAAGSLDTTVSVWLVAEEDGVESRPPQVLQGHTEFVTSVAWAPDGRSLASGSWDGNVRVWQVSERGAVSGNASLVLQGQADHVTSVAWAPDSLSLACGRGSRDLVNGTVWVWRVSDDNTTENTTSHQVLQGYSGWVTSVAWSPDGRSLACGAWNAVHVWRMGEIGAVQVGVPPVLGDYAPGVSSVAWAPDGRSLASGSEDATVRVWAVDGNSTVEDSAPQVLLGHNDEVPSLAWAPDGRSLASGSFDGTVNIWRLLRVEHMLQALDKQTGLHSWDVSMQEAAAQGYPASLFSFEPVYFGT
eukprot:jgi/Tetstr1/445982/TSEL_003539.t1